MTATTAMFPRRLLLSGFTRRSRSRLRILATTSITTTTTTTHTFPDFFCLSRRTLSTNNKPPDFSDPNYWNEYHNRSPSLDWFTSDNAPLLISIAQTVTSLRPTDRPSDRPFKVLHVGAGTSSLCEILHSHLDSTNLPFELTHTDITQSSVSILQNRSVQNVVKLDVTCPNQTSSLGLSSYDLIVDKGLLDCFVHSTSSSSSSSLKSTLKNFSNLLSDSGTYLMITNDSSDSRFDDFMNYGDGDWDLRRFNSRELVSDGEGDVVVNVIKVRLKN
ncbi:hypothetical protein TrLO_g2156 [Triparma laevis f. longispina]|uniref:Uncharacterized protein n=1 Tax=Triparma laevis f. longispina TaxID=1714387 RepID=A0A9W7FV98_9STRA|nr:hypothetical protein TrLO_g2156 [Triparma laevis f. longispina]